MGPLDPLGGLCYAMRDHTGMLLFLTYPGKATDLDRGL
jgi:hypothetical protein